MSALNSASPNDQKFGYAHKISLYTAILTQGIRLPPGRKRILCLCLPEGRFSLFIEYKRIAAPGNFYGDGNIEATLSVLEAQFASLARTLREGECSSDSKPQIDRFVAHSLVRTQAFREGVHDIGVAVLRESFQELLNPQYAPQLLAKLVEDALKEPPASELLAAAPPTARPKLESAMRQRLLDPSMRQLLREAILPSLNLIDTRESVQSAQRKALESDQHLDKRIDDLATIRWRIELYDTHSLILGDIGPLIRGNESEEWGRVFHGTPRAVWFPLSDQSLLIGETIEGVENPNCDEVNVASAENSIEFIAASQNTHREEGYQKRIGTRVDRASPAQLSEMKRMVRDYLTTPGGTLSMD
ncbi:MAG: DUF4238 domain-containing protein [Nitrospira sp.]|nr:DUF4238 domain-containing protein [Nitrospira sp.]